MVWIALVIGIALLFAFPKQIGALIAIVVAVCGSLLLYEYAEDKQEEKQKSLVTVSVRYDLVACSEEYPLLVRIDNASDAVVHRTSWDFVAHNPGYSNNVVDGYGDYYTDKIIGRGKSYSLCYRIPKLKRGLSPENLDWSVKWVQVRFDK